MQGLIIVVGISFGVWLLWELSFGPVYKQRKLANEKRRLKSRLKEVRREIKDLNSKLRRQWNYALHKKLCELMKEERELVERQEEVKLWIKAA